jgi:EAL domain-containing protein (putative c-di-GMP-specific phosphodiesterase class I)
MNTSKSNTATQYNEAEIRAAINAGDLFYVYQPTISLFCGRVCGAEALLRWDRNGETIYPDEFIPMAEKSSLASDITNAMLPVLIRDMQVMEIEAPGLVTSFNACANDCIDGKMTATIVQAVSDGLIMPGSIRIEVTETSLAENIDKLRDQFQILLDAGVKLAMDDLGKGYSSLDLLSKLPFTCLKIDKDIVSNIHRSEKSRHIIQAICDLSKKIGVTLIAEGVENRKIYMELERMDCHQAQGYWIGQPMTFNQYMNFVRLHHLWRIRKAAA